MKKGKLILDKNNAKKATIVQEQNMSKYINIEYKNGDRELKINKSHNDIYRICIINKKEFKSIAVSLDVLTEILEDYTFEGIINLDFYTTLEFKEN